MLTPLKSKILIADEDIAHLHFLRNLLEESGYTVEHTENGHEVIDKVRTLRYDMALISSDMAGMDGFQVCRLLKEFEKTRHIPVMIFSGQNDHVIRNQAITAGAEDFISKPVNRAELLTRVYTLLRIKSLHDKLENLITEKEAEKQKLIQRTEELRILSDIARIVISIKDRKEILSEITNNVVKAFYSESGFLISKLDNVWTLESVSDSAGARVRPGPLEAPATSLFEFIGQNEKPIIINDARADDRVSSLLSGILGIDISKMVCSPIFVRSKVIGILIIVNKIDGTDFASSDLTLLMTIAGQMALAIENIQLFDKLSDFNRNLQVQISEATYALTELKNFNESILQNISSGILTVDFEGRIIFANKAGEEILGLTKGQLVNRSLSDIFGQKASQVLVVPTKTEEAVQGDEIQLMTHDNKEIFLGYTTSVRYDSNGKMAGYIISFRDITHIKQMRDTIQRMDRLVSLGLLTGGIAHEIRNPLAGIKTLAQALEREIPMDDLKIEYIRRIIKQINRLNELLKAFFTYAKPGRPERQSQSLPAIINEVKILLKQRAHTDHITIEEHYDPHLPLLYVDGNQMEQVFLNLLINAMDAIGQHGKLTISARPVRRTIPPRILIPQDAVEVRITDTGIGITPENVKSIFDPFFTTKPNGVGLGLSIVYRIIHEHGGEIDVESEPGKGTTFMIVLPLKDIQQNFDLTAIQNKLTANGKIIP